MPPRIPYRDENDPELHELVEKIRARRRGNRLINLDRLLIHSPPYANGWNALLGAVRRDLEIDPQIRELAICAVAKLNDAPYEWVQHAREYLAEGGPQAKLDALADVEAAAVDTTNFDDRERAALRLTLESTRQVKVSEATFREARKQFGDRQLVELVGTIGAYNMVSRFLEAFGIDEKGE